MDRQVAGDREHAHRRGEDGEHDEARVARALDGRGEDDARRIEEAIQRDEPKQDRPDLADGRGCFPGTGPPGWRP